MKSQVRFFSCGISHVKRTVPFTPCPSIDLQHSIADADVGLYISRGTRRGLQLLAQRDHKYAQRSYIVVPAPAPDILSYVCVGQHLPWEIDRRRLERSCSFRAMTDACSFSCAFRRFSRARAHSPSMDMKTVDRFDEEPVEEKHACQ